MDEDEPMDEEPEVDPLYGFLYSIRIFPTDGRPSDFAPLVGLFPLRPPPPPSDVEVEAAAAAIEVTWESEEDPKNGFRVYRREAKSRLYGPAVGTLPGSSRSYRDASAIYGARYIYGVTAVGRANPLIESEIPSEHEVDYQDRFGPEKPGNLVAFPEASRIRLLWDASNAADFAGYRIYRRAEGSEEEILVTEELVTRSQYVDESVLSGQVWFYSVTSVDALGNTSDPAKEIRVQVP